MSAAAVVDLGMMLLSAILSEAIHSALVMMVITGGIPLLAIATVSAIEGGVNVRALWPGGKRGGELTQMATRLRNARE